MATLLLSSAGAAAGSFIGGSFLGFSSVVIGQSIGTVIGASIDRALFAPTIENSVKGPRLSNARVLSSVEGQNIWRGYGRFKVAGNVIWATRLNEEVIRKTSTQGGKGGGGGVKTTTTTFNYTANFAVGLSEGEISEIHRVWADGKLIRLEDFTYRIYKGTETQLPDSLMEQKDGAGNVPAYRGLAYIVFENMPINQFGNRIPQMAFEITKPVKGSISTDKIKSLMNSVCLIPGTTEFGYDPNLIQQSFPGGEVLVENNHLGNGRTDWENALDQLATNFPNVTMIVFVITWFADDLRIGECSIEPRVENKTKQTTPINWLVSGLNRDTAKIVSQLSVDNPAFGGTPNDSSVYQAIIDLKARGYEVMLYPFLLVDVPDGNSLQNPYSDNAAEVGQPVYPWRGRITVSPARGFVGTNDKTAAAATQVANFLGSASAADFSGSNGLVSYSGSAERSYKRFILHLAELCRQAGGVEYFAIGTEMVEACRVRDDTGNFPFVDGLIDIATQVKVLMPLAKVSYAADWSEYNGFRPVDGTGDVLFHLDPLWSNVNIDFIGIDNYLKLSDWRDGDNHADFGVGADSFGNPKTHNLYDLEYLKGQIEGGEDYDYFYTSEINRANQTRTLITDGLGKPWVFRQKDIKNWWLNQHFNRPGGVEDATSTGWVPQSKPIIFTEFGTSALDKSTNRPNVFFDPKSSESQIPYFSSGARDDEIQRQYIIAMIEYWQDTNNNPSSDQYSGRMIDSNKMAYWSYDARPWPTFPLDGDAWADQDNWQFGHWISGRVDTVHLPALLSELALDYDVTAQTDFIEAYGSMDGFTIQERASFRDVVSSLSTLFMFDIIESGPVIKAVTQRESVASLTATLNDLGGDDEGDPVKLTRAQESDLPLGMSINYIDVFNDYDPATVSQRRETVESESTPETDTPMVIDSPRAQQIVDRLLYSAWAGRTKSSFKIMPQFIALEAGDVIQVDDRSFNIPLRVQSISDGPHREISAKSFDRGIFESTSTPGRSQRILTQPGDMAPSVSYMDLPILQSVVSTPEAPYVAASLSPWVGVDVYLSITDSNFELDTSVITPAIMGNLTADFNAGDPNVWDTVNDLKVLLFSGELQTVNELNVLNSANAMAIESSPDRWEIIQFVNAQLTGTREYTLTKLLRGQLGTEDAIEPVVSTGARIVFLDSTIQQLGLGVNDIGREYFLRAGPGNKDVGDPLYNTVQKTFTGRGLRPYSPALLEASIDGSGDTQISWVRRTRINGDSWDYTTDVPLNEAFEKYEVDIIDGGMVIRTIPVTDATSVVYTNAQRTLDSVFAPFDIAVYQLSDQVGRGIGRRITVNG